MLCFFLLLAFLKKKGLPGRLSRKESAFEAGDPPAVQQKRGRSPAGGNGNPLQYSCLENPRDRGAWWATCGGKESDTTEVAEHTHTIDTKFYPFRASLIF